MQVQVNWTGAFTNYNHPLEIHTLVFIVVTCSRAGLWTDKSHKVSGRIKEGILGREKESIYWSAFWNEMVPC